MVRKSEITENTVDMSWDEARSSASFMQASIREEECANRHASAGGLVGRDDCARGVRGCASAGHAGFEAGLPRPDERQPRRLDAGGGDVGFEQGTDVVADSGGGVWDYSGRHFEGGCEEYSQCSR